MLLVKLKVSQEKGTLALPDKKKTEKTYLNLQLIWLKHSMKTMNFLDKCLKKKKKKGFLMLLFVAIPTKKID